MTPLRTFALVTVFFSVSISSSAQRNLIDVPSSEIVKSKILFFQQQFSFTKGEVNSSSIFTYGLGKKFELGLAIYKLKFKNGEGLQLHDTVFSENPEILINAQQGLIAKKWFALSAGTRSGLATTSNDSDLKFATFDYINSKISMAEGLYQIYVGAYYANDTYAGPGTNIGLMGGLNVLAIKNRLSVLADFYSGNNTLAMVNTGLQLSMKRKWKLVGAAQFGVPGSGNENGATIQLSKN